eukprot:6172275-Pleurochrysis_carterae.AAC.1
MHCGPWRCAQVREPYSAAIPTYRNKFDPLRYDTGFLRSPNYARGVPSAPSSPLRSAGIGSPPSMSPNSKQKKFGFDKVVLGTQPASASEWFATSLVRKGARQYGHW